MANRYSTLSTTNITTATTDADDDIQEVVPVKSEPGDLSVLSSAPAQDIFSPAQASHALTTADDTLDYQEEEYEEYEQYQESRQYQGGQGAMDDQQMKGDNYFIL